MKLIYITSARIPTAKAHGYQICQMCQQFAELGLAVELWAPARNNPIKEDLYEYYGLKRNFVVKKIASPDFLKYEKYLGRLSFYLTNLLFLFKLKRLPSDDNDLIYTRDSAVAWLFGRRGCRVVFEAHYWPESKVGWFKKQLRRAEKIVVMTEALKKIFVEHGFKEKKILVAPDGVDLGIFDIAVSRQQARQELALPGDKIILGYSGSFRTMGQDKGLKIILQAMEILTRHDQKIMFAAVGGSQADIDYYQAAADRLGLGEWVRLLPRVQINRLGIFQQACDILLMPFPRRRHYEYYMSPNKMFEYLASGRPIVASDLPAVREILSEHEAVLVEPDDASGLARGIERLLKDKELAERLARQALAKARHYSWRRRAERIWEFIR